MGDVISIPVCEKCGKHHISLDRHSYDKCDVCGSQLVDKKYSEIIEKKLKKDSGK